MVEQAVKGPISNFPINDTEFTDFYKTLQDFRKTFSLDEYRAFLWELLERWVISYEGKIMPDLRTSNLFFFYRHSIKMMEAAYVFHYKGSGIITPETGDVTTTAITQAPPAIVEASIEPCTLEVLLRIIIGTLDPEMVFLINPLDNPLAIENTPLELLILLSSKHSKSNDCYQEAITSATRQFPNVIYLFRRGHEIAQLLKKGHIFYSRVCNKRQLLYTNNPDSIHLPEGLNPPDNQEEFPLHNQLIITAIQEKARKGFKLCHNFLEGAMYYKLNKEYGLAAFMLQQATEHTLRSSILLLMDRNFKTHNLSRLLQTCRFCAKELLLVFPRDTEKEKAIFKLLNAAYIGARYTDKYHISEEELEILLERVARLQTKAKEICMESIKALNAI